MRTKKDKLSNDLLSLILKNNEPLETKELELSLKKYTRTKILYRLMILRGDGLIKGKPVGSGKGTWIWWRGDAFGL